MARKSKPLFDGRFLATVDSEQDGVHVTVVNIRTGRQCPIYYNGPNTTVNCRPFGMHSAGKIRNYVLDPENKPFEEHNGRQLRDFGALYDLYHQGDEEGAPAVLVMTSQLYHVLNYLGEARNTNPLRFRLNIYRRLSDAERKGKNMDTFTVKGGWTIAKLSEQEKRKRRIQAQAEKHLPEVTA